MDILTGRSLLRKIIFDPKIIILLVQKYILLFKMIVNFSVILNTFERESQLSDLKKCFKSIFNQSIKPKEIIVVHSGNKKFQSNEFKKYSNKIKIINCPKKTNISEAREYWSKKKFRQFFSIHR